MKPVYAETDVHGNPLTDEQKEWTEDNTLRLESFRKSNWKTGASRDAWSDLLKEAANAHYEAEWRSAIDPDSDRQAAIIHIDNYNREEWMRRIGKYDLYYRDIRYSAPYDGYSHKHLPTDEHDLERITYSVISTDEDVADDFHYTESEIYGAERHRIVGEYLNFPDCCIDFFNDVWNDQGQIDPIYEMACNTPSAEPVDGDNNTVRIEDFTPWNNMLWRYLGLSYPTHIPCSFTCEKTEEISQYRHELMCEHGYEEAAKALIDWLHHPTVWSGHNALAHIKNEYLIASSQTSEYWNKKTVILGEQNPSGGSII